MKEGGCLDPGGPHLEAGLDELALLGVQALGGDFADGGACEHRDTQVQQCLVHRLADALRQCRQDFRAGLDEGDVYILRLDAIEAVGRQLLGGVQQFCSQLHAGSAGSDDGHADVARGTLACMRLHVMAQQLPVEALGLLARIKEDAVLGSPRGAEVVGRAADGNHQRVVVQRA